MQDSSIRDIALPLQLLEMSGDPRHKIFGSPAAIQRLESDAIGSISRKEDADTMAARTWAAALRARAATARTLIPGLMRTLKLAATLQLIADVVNLTSVTSLIVLISGTDDATVSKIATAVIAAATSLFSTVVSVLHKNAIGGNRTEELAALVMDLGAAEGIALDLEIWADASPPRPPLDSNLIQARALVAKFIASMELEASASR